MNRIEKILRHRARNLREVYRGMRHRRPVGNGHAAGRLMLVGAPGFAADVPHVPDRGSADGPFPLPTVLSWRLPAEHTGTDVILATESLDADAARAVDQIRHVLRHAAYRLILTAASPHARKRLDTLRNALHEHGSGCVAQILPGGCDDSGPGHVILVKRRIGHLVLVAGPSAAGKSSFMKRFIQGAQAGSESRSRYAAGVGVVADHLGMTPGRHWAPSAYAKHLHEVSAPALDRLLLQYDFSRPAQKYWTRHGSDPVLDVLDTASRTSAITLWTPPDRLREQVRQRDRTRTPLSRRPRRASKMQRYADPANVLQMYDDFFQEIEGRVTEHCLIEIGTSIQLHDVAEWQRLHRFAAA